MFNHILPFMDSTNRNIMPQPQQGQIDPATQIAFWKLGQILAQNSISQNNNNINSDSICPKPSVDFQDIFKTSFNTILAQLAQNATNPLNITANNLSQTQENSSHESGIFSNSTTTPPPAEELLYSTSSSTGSPVHETSDGSVNIQTSTVGTNKNSKKCGFQAGITVGYTYDAFFVSDGRSKRRKSNTSANLSSEEQAPAQGPVQSTSSSSEGSLIMSICNEQAEAKRTQRYSCSECGKHYATSSNLSRHKQTHRSLDSKMAKKCPHCGKAYVSMPALSMHILTHDLRHRCDICGKAFSRPWLLQGHRRAHTGEKPYGCAHCGRAFADRSNLRAHMQIHSQMKQFQCHHCDKGFVLKSYLNKHLETCVGEGSVKDGSVITENDLPTQLPPVTANRQLPFSLSIASLVDG